MDHFKVDFPKRQAPSQSSQFSEDDQKGRDVPSKIMQCTTGLTKLCMGEV